MEKFFQVGIITATHGLRGEVKVFPTTDDPYRYDDLDEVFLESGNEKILLHVQRVKYFKQFVIVKFKEFDSINEIEKYRKCSLLVSRENAVPVVTDEGVLLGPLKDVLQTGANDVYVVDGKEKEILIPSIKQCILNVDLEKGEILVHLLEGLLDL
jgi:16S rRNA processing protein RimM